MVSWGRQRRRQSLLRDAPAAEASAAGHPGRVQRGRRDQEPWARSQWMFKLLSNCAQWQWRTSWCHYIPFRGGKKNPETQKKTGNKLFHSHHTTLRLEPFLKAVTQPNKIDVLFQHCLAESPPCHEQKRCYILFHIQNMLYNPVGIHRSYVLTSFQTLKGHLTVNRGQWTTCFSIWLFFSKVSSFSWHPCLCKGGYHFPVLQKQRVRMDCVAFLFPSHSILPS